MAERNATTWQAAEREAQGLLRAAGQGPPLPAYLLAGAEHGPLRRLGRRLVDQLLPGEDRIGLELLYGSEVSPAEVAARLTSGGLLFGGERRVVWVQNAAFLGREGRDRLEPLLQALDRRGASGAVLLLTVTGLLDGRNPVLEWIRQHGVVLEWPALRHEREAEAWLRARLQRAGRRASPEAVAEIAFRCGTRLETLLNESEKLLLYVGERGTIELDDVRAVIIASPEASAFDLVDAVAERQVADALQILRTLFQNKVPPLMILGMLLRQFRLLLQARTLIDRAPDPPVWRDGARGFRQALQRQDPSGRTLLDRWRAALEGSLPRGRTNLLALHPFPFWKVMGQAERFSARALSRAFERLMQADLALKGNLFSPETALEMLIVDLVERMEAGATLDWEELLE